MGREPSRWVRRWFLGGVVALVGLLGLKGAFGPPEARLAQQILKATGVKGGLFVHLGCGEGDLLAELYRNTAREEGGRLRSPFVAHGLESDPSKVKRARQRLRKLGLYGPVSVGLWRGGRLPYVDNLVNLLVASKPLDLSVGEILRVLAPRGVALLPEAMAHGAEGRAQVSFVNLGGRRWAKVVKPVPKGIDDWPQYLYDATGNAVSHDVVVGPPRCLQWVSGPPHTRSHEHTPSIMALVSSKGRLFYIADEGPIRSVRKPPRWRLVARDAFNGVLLWKRDIKVWFPHIWVWGATPPQLQRRLVAAGDRLYATLGFIAPVSELDAETGRTLRTFEGTEGADELVLHDGVLLLVVREVTRERVEALRKWFELEREEDSPLYERETLQPRMKGFLKIQYKAPLKVMAIDLRTGRVLWSRGEKWVQPLSLCADGDRAFYRTGGEVVCLDLRTGRQIWVKPAPRLWLAAEGRLVCTSKEKVVVLSELTGDVLWEREPPVFPIIDVFLINGSLWLGGFAEYKGMRSPSHGCYWLAQMDIRDGKVLGWIKQENPGHHHRCWRNKATVRYVLSGRRGVEFNDLRKREVLWHSWVRGVCRYGIMPANGLLYAPPHACACYISTKLDGFFALSSRPVEEPEEEGRLERGPAYGKVEPREARADEWPTYRHDPRRSGHTPSPVPAQLRQLWRAKIGGKLTAPTVADGKVFVASVDEHTVYALDARTGRVLWSYTAGGRVDAPPTFYRGMVLFGSHDGYVYCLRASDGELCWRFRAARAERRIVSYGQVESPWPVVGGVLVCDGSAYFAAGTSSYLDGGIDIYRVKPETGEVLAHTTIYSPINGRQPPQYDARTMPGERADVLVAGERFIFLRDMALDKRTLAESKETEFHLMALTGILDDTWPHRSYWLLGTRFPFFPRGPDGDLGNIAFGRLLAFDESAVYGYGRERTHWSNQLRDGPYRLFGIDIGERMKALKQPEPKRWKRFKAWLSAGLKWTLQPDIEVRALALAGDVLFAAGPPKEEGNRPALLALSAEDGVELFRCALDSPPVFDGMAAANGKIVLCGENGEVVCLGR